MSSTGPSNPQQNPSSSASASPSPVSYASATKKTVSSPAVATSSAAPSPAVAVGGVPPVQQQHGKSASISPVNGRAPITPAVPAVAAPAVAHSNMNGEHSRKNSVTFNANSDFTNGGPVGGRGSIQFGNVNDSPAPAQSTPQPPTASTPIPIPGNPRVTSPAQSPSPIPQPSASGGRPPSVAQQGNGPTFGSFGGDGDRHMRQASLSQTGANAASPQSGHLRRESTHSHTSDMSNGNHRGGFQQQGGRGRGAGFNGQFQQQGMQYAQQNGPNFRGGPNAGRGGMPPQFQPQGRPMGQYPNSPHQAARSPAMTNSMPGTPNMGQAMPMQSPQPYTGYHQPYMGTPQGYGGYAPVPPYDRMTGMPPQPYMYGQMPYMQAAPPSPQPAFQATYMPGQNYQAQGMTRTPSQLSERPGSGFQPQTPMAQGASHTAQQKPSPASTPSIQRGPRKSAAIPIVKPDGDVLDLSSVAKPPASPAANPQQQPRTPPVVASTPTPPPKSITPQPHTRTDSSAKSSEQIRQEFKEQLKKAADDSKAREAAAADADAKAADAKAAEEKAKADAEAKAAEEKAKAEAEAKAKAEEEAKAKAEEEAKAKAEAEAKAAADKAKQDEEDEMERMIREMEEADAAREKAEEEHRLKREAEKEAAKKEAEKNRLANAADEDRKLREAEREMERLEDEKERKRAEAEAKAAGGDAAPKAEEKTVLTPSTLAAKMSGLSLGGSGASTPASDDSMGPPPRGAEKRGKPAALNLAPLNTKPVEPPQPSAALQSLKSARFLNHFNKDLYPANIASPNPALNAAVISKGKNFKYDKEFLLQFQKVFTEKPSTEFDAQIKSLMGDGEGGSSRSGSTRGGGASMARQGSNRNSSGAFSGMGTFGANGFNGKTLPPGTTSEARFAMSQGTLPRPGVNPMASFNRPGSAFGTNPMSRTPSSSGVNGPNSPRATGSRSGRQGSRQAGGGQSKQAEANAAARMPLTANKELEPIKVTAGGWKPRSVGKTATAAAGASDHMDPDTVQRKVKANLNKMTPEKFDKIADQILAIAAQSRDEADGRTLRQVIQLTFEKATDEAHWASMYAKFCKKMLESMSPEIRDETITDKNGNVVSGGNLFRKYLLNRCQEEFERGWKVNLPEKPEDADDENKTEEAAMLSDEYYIAAAAKRRGLGLVQFIGELYKLGMLTERIMHECVRKLVDYTGVPDEAEIESLTKLLKTIGANLDSTEKGRPYMDVYFQRIQGMIDLPGLAPRLKFMLMDIVDLRKKQWASKEVNKGPKTIAEVRAEAEAEAIRKAQENAKTSQRGGARMQVGRGDSRGSFYGQPPVDHQRNTVGMDDLRRLANKSSANRTSSQQTFGPTAMFSSRSNSGRRGLGPGGSLSRTGEDSGASSRTGTPPQQKEKESTTHVNAFSLLAQMNDNETPASPPSAATSPALAKATPAGEEKQE